MVWSSSLCQLPIDPVPQLLKKLNLFGTEKIPRHIPSNHSKQEPAANSQLHSPKLTTNPRLYNFCDWNKIKVGDTLAAWGIEGLFYCSKEQHDCQQSFAIRDIVILALQWERFIHRHFMTCRSLHWASRKILEYEWKYSQKLGYFTSILQIRSMIVSLTKDRFENSVWIVRWYKKTRCSDDDNKSTNCGMFVFMPSLWVWP